MNTKDDGCRIGFGFARSVERAAEMVRVMGDDCERRAYEEEGAGSVWDDRAWLTVEEWEV
jgi:hypothetical protein